MQLISHESNSAVVPNSRRGQRGARGAARRLRRAFAEDTFCSGHDGGVPNRPAISPVPRPRPARRRPRGAASSGFGMATLVRLADVGRHRDFLGKPLYSEHYRLEVARRGYAAGWPVVYRGVGAVYRGGGEVRAVTRRQRPPRASSRR